MAELSISMVADQPHVVITHPELTGASLILRAPEFVRSPDRAHRCFPGDVGAELVEPRRRVRYWWSAPANVKERYGADFSGCASTGDDCVTFEIINRNIGSQPHDSGAWLLCLQAGQFRMFHDPDGHRTLVHCDGWKSVHQMQQGRLEDHRMWACCVGQQGVGHNLMVKVATDDQWVLAIAIDRDGHVSCNQQVWPSCIHANPRWPVLQPGAAAAVRGRVYLLRGTPDLLIERYKRDFGERPTDS